MSADETASRAYGFEFLKGCAADIVAELSPPKHGSHLVCEGPYGLPLAPFDAFTPRPPSPENIRSVLETVKREDGRESSNGDNSKLDSSNKRETQKKAQPESLLQRSFSVDSVVDMSNISTTVTNPTRKSPRERKHKGKHQCEEKRGASPKQSKRMDGEGRAGGEKGAKPSKDSRSRRKLLKKAMSVDCVSDCLLEDDEVVTTESHSKRKHLRKARSADRVAGLPSDEMGAAVVTGDMEQKSQIKARDRDRGDRKRSSKQKSKMQRAKSSRDVLGSRPKHGKSANGKSAKTGSSENKSSSRGTAKRRGMDRSISSDCLNDLLSCFTSEKAKESLATLESQKIRKEKSHSKRRPRLNKCLSVSCLSSMNAAQSKQSSRKAESLRARATRKNKSSKKASRIIPEINTAEAGVEKVKPPPTFERSHSTPDVNVPFPVSAAVSAEPTNNPVSGGTRIDFTSQELPRNSLKKSVSVPDMIQPNNSTVDDRISDFYQPQKMSLDEACKSLRANDKDLVSLDLSEEPVGDAGVKSLSVALQNNWFLCELHVARSGITHVGAIDLAHALGRNKTLERLYLQGNSLGDEGVEAIASALSDNKTLAVLNLARNNVGDIGAAALAEMASSFRLQKLYLYENKIADIGAMALGEMITTNTTLHELFIWDNAFGEKGASELRLAMNYKEENHPWPKLHIRSSWKYEGVVSQV